MKRTILFAAFTVAAGIAQAVQPDADSLMGIHWYLNTDAISPGQATDVEDMANDTGIWITEITHLNTAAAPVWDQPGYHASHAQKSAQGKGHSFIYRIQPYWNANVPHPDDPYTIANFADDAKAAAITLKDWVHIWQIGNEVNLDGENRRWATTDYSGATWQPTPEQYAETYIAVRDKIHEADSEVAPETQIVLMQPNSPGSAQAGVRFMDGNEFLFRQIDAVADKSKIDGFALHSYAEPGGANFGMEGFMDAIREQLMIIDWFGLGDRPVYITEFNKHMPNSTEATIGAKFLHNAYTTMNSWNNSTGGIWPGQPNHNIVAATWFVYPATSWQDYSLQHWKSQIVSTDKDQNPWYSFEYASTLGYGAGAKGGGPTSVPLNQIWFEDEFNGSSIDQTPSLPDWHIQTTGSGLASTTGTGAARLRGNNSNMGGASLFTRGYVFADFRMEADIELTDASRAGSPEQQANFEFRVREGSKGYSLTFFTADSLVTPNTVVLRRVNDWTQIGSYSQVIGGNGIASGDTFKVVITAEGSALRFLVYENGGASPVVDFDVTDSEQKVGYIRVGTWNLNELRVDRLAVGGPEWTGQVSSAGNWRAYE